MAGSIKTIEILDVWDDNNSIHIKVCPYNQTNKSVTLIMDITVAQHLRNLLNEVVLSLE